MKETMNCVGCRRILEQETVAFGGMLLEYRLLLANDGGDRFRVRVALGSEAAEYGIGDQLASALERYRLLVRGTVTPCCLREVLEVLCG